MNTRRLTLVRLSSLIAVALGSVMLGSAQAARIEPIVGTLTARATIDHFATDTDTINMMPSPSYRRRSSLRVNS